LNLVNTLSNSITDAELLMRMLKTINKKTSKIREAVIKGNFEECQKIWNRGY